MKKKLIKYGVELMILIILVIGFVVINRYITHKREILNENVYDYNSRIDSLTFEDGVLKISGWCYRYMMNTPVLSSEDAGNFKVLLFNEAMEIDEYEDLEKASLCTGMKDLKMKSLCLS